MHLLMQFPLLCWNLIGIWAWYYLCIIMYSIFDFDTLQLGSKNIKDLYHFDPGSKIWTFFQDNNTSSSRVGEIAAAKFYWQLKKEGEGCQREQVPRKITTCRAAGLEVWSEKKIILVQDLFKLFAAWSFPLHRKT